MPAVLSNIRLFTACAALALLSGTAFATDAYDAAVKNPARTAADQKRDALDHPAQMLRLAGLKSGMKVADFIGGDGYYSELASYIVGPTGHVLLINNAPFDAFSRNAWKERLANNRLPNVEHMTVDLAHLKLAENSLDAVLLVKVYHDLYWVQSDKSEWPDVPVAAVLDTIAHALKPGGTLLIIDHSAKAGAKTSVASTLHRIDEDYTVHDFESRGLKVVGRSQVLRNPDDARDQMTYKGPMVGKTDRFVLVLRKTK